MKKFFKILPLLILAVIISVGFVGIRKSKAHRPQYFKQEVFSSIEYLETPLQYSIIDVEKHSSEFSKLGYPNNKNLTKLLKNPENLLWLRIEFEIPKELKNKDVGLFIGRLRSSAMLFINRKFIRKYGATPPVAMTSGYVAQYYMFAKNDLNPTGINTVYIQVWPGPMGSISKNVYIGEQAEIFQHAERLSYFNSKFILTFAGLSIFIAFMYFVLYFVLKKHKEIRMYLLYGLTNFYTAHFLLYFFLTEVSWIKPPFISYLTILKFSLCYGGFTTVYFASSFISSYLGYEASKKEMIIRLILLAIPTLIAFALPNDAAFIKYMPYLIIPVVAQFGFCVPRIFKDLMNKEKRSNVLHILQAFSPLYVTLAVDVIVRILKIDDTPIFTLYGWQITIYIFLWQLLKQFGEMYIHNTTLKSQLESFNTNLESVVALRTKELSEANYVLSRGLESVSHVQKNFLPPEKNIFRGWDISVFYQPLDNNVSGDLYDYYFTDATLDGLGIFDVSGHGIPAGLMTILAKGIISQHFLNGLAQEASISEILEEINESYIKEKVNVENYITGLLFHFSDFNKNGICSVEVANAGHPYPILYNAEKGTLVEIKHENPDEQYGIIGVEGLDVSFPPVNFRMGKDDIIVCFTDGLTEAVNTSQEDFSRDRLISIIRENKNLSADELSKVIIDDFKEFTKDQPTTDDVTLIVLKRTDPKDYLEEI